MLNSQNVAAATMQRGNQYLNTGATKLTNAMANSVDAMRVGVQAAQLGLAWANASSQKHNFVLGAGQSSLAGMLNLLNHGDRVQDLVIKNNQNCFQANKELVNCSKEFMGAMYNRAQSTLQQSLAASSAVGQGLLATAEQNAQSSFGSFGDAVQGIFNANAPIGGLPGQPSLGGPPSSGISTGGGTNIYTNQPNGGGVVFNNNNTSTFGGYTSLDGQAGSAGVGTFNPWSVLP